MYQIYSSAKFKRSCPQFKGIAIFSEVKNSETSADLWKEIDDVSAFLRSHFTAETIKSRSGIAATRLAYRAAGKDPSRYRPACEQLARRILQGKELYSVNTLVDLVNLVSLLSGYSTAALDCDKLSGNEIVLDFGNEDEPYEGIGRGKINIANLPVYRDQLGAFATPTSDSTRTMLSLNTQNLLVLINGYDGDEANLLEASNTTQQLLRKYAEGKNFHVLHY